MNDFRSEGQEKNRESRNQSETVRTIERLSGRKEESGRK